MGEEKWTGVESWAEVVVEEGGGEEEMGVVVEVVVDIGMVEGEVKGTLKDMTLGFHARRKARN